MKILFGSVVYRSAQKYLPDFLQSLGQQTREQFSLLLINDDMDTEELRNYVSGYSFDTEVIDCSHRTPAQLRVKLLKEAKLRQADLLILGDCDDYFSKTRVEAIVDQYKKNLNEGFFYNELVDSSGMKLMPQLPKCVCDFKEIGEYNFLGLSNSAINITNLSLDFIDSLNEYQYEVFDWYFFSRMLMEGYSGRRVDRCNTVYRLHENNIAGIAMINEESIEREILVKKRHYNSLKDYEPYYIKKYSLYKAEQFEILDKQDKHFWWNLLKCNQE